MSNHIFWEKYENISKYLCLIDEFFTQHAKLFIPFILKTEQMVKYLKSVVWIETET